MVQRLLFLCSKNKLRSPTAEQVFATWEGLETASAGLDRSADVIVSSEQLEWADIIFVMEREHRDKLTRRFKRPLRGKRIIVLGIPDNYALMAPALVSVLKDKVSRHLRLQ